MHGASFEEQLVRCVFMAGMDSRAELPANGELPF